MGLFSVVRFDGLRDRDWIVYKYPSEKLSSGSSLIVQEGQVAIFVRGGMICDIMYPGSYKLNTQNLPVLASIVNIPFGGSTPFPAEIYFLNALTKLDIYWGTSDPIQLIDPKYQIKLRLRAFGQMGLKICDFATFFRELIGGMNKGDWIKYDKVQEYYKGVVILKIKSILANIVINEGISALEISTRLEEISDKAKYAISDEFAKYGMTVVNFYVKSINFPDEDFDKINSILQDKAAFDIMGDSRYVAKRSFDVYETAAGNDSGIAGAFVAGGIGFGAGMNMMQNVNNPNFNVGYNNSVSMTRTCPCCGIVVVENSRFCSNCGTSFMSKMCTCGQELQPGARFCLNCGKKVD